MTRRARWTVESVVWGILAGISFLAVADEQTSTIATAVPFFAVMGGA